MPNPAADRHPPQTLRGSLRQLASLYVPSRRPPFALAVGAIIVGGLLSLLLLNTVLAQRAFLIHDLTQKQRDLEVLEQDVRLRLAEREKPSGLSAYAQHLGMIPDPRPLYLQKPGDVVLGTTSRNGPWPLPDALVLQTAKPGDVLVVADGLPVAPPATVADSAAAQPSSPATPAGTGSPASPPPASPVVKPAANGRARPAHSHTPTPTPSAAPDASASPTPSGP